ncbi:uncharacterized protein LOC143446564 isoform X2 [Clavelina lepadiformis]|uniref:uncharacterized protein LOC143446564 isoform X2 n=1 Tax=Clavelina lepadiformis TaxID=159417 RepID=UPI0040429498
MVWYGIIVFHLLIVRTVRLLPFWVILVFVIYWLWLTLLDKDKALPTEKIQVVHGKSLVMMQLNCPVAPGQLLYHALKALTDILLRCFIKLNNQQLPVKIRHEKTACKRMSDYTCKMF